MRQSKALNAARSTPIRREERISEAGEIFTPAHVVTSILRGPAIAPLVADSRKTVLEPAAGDGNFVVEIVRQRLDPARGFAANLAALQKTWAIEIQADNLTVLRSRVIEIARSRLRVDSKQLQQIVEWAQTNLLQGNYLTGRACTLACPATCAKHELLALPPSFDLLAGNPPFNPQRMFTKFVEKALSEAATVVMIVPASWKISPQYKGFRARIAPYAVSWNELRWDTFAIKPRTGVLTLSAQKDRGFRYEGEQVPLCGPSYRFEDNILRKARAAWPYTLSKFSTTSTQATDPVWPLHIGWKCNLRRDGNRMNMLQSVDYEYGSALLPNHTFAFDFPTEQLRRSWIIWSTTKLAAYMQQCTNSDTVSRELPFPGHLTVGISDFDLYEYLGLTPLEIRRVEQGDLYISGKAAEFYGRVGAAIRSDALIGDRRPSCVSCGSSSFHKKGCSNATEREAMLRDS